MTQAQHTQGPWHIDDLNCMVFAANGLRVADCLCDDQDDMTDDEAEANAKLIAAGPKMLQALEAIQARLAGVWDNPALVAQGPCYDTENQCADIAKAAIAAARGQQP